MRAFRNAGAQVVALVDLDPRVRTLAEHIGAHVLTDASALPADMLDLVVVALPTRLQPDVTAVLLDAGHHVLSEKPVAADVGGAAILATVPGVDDRLMIGYTLHHHPAAALASDWVTRNEVVAITVRSVARKRDVSAWRADPREGGVAVVNGIHAIELVSSWFGGEPDVLATRSSSQLYGSPVAEHLSTLFAFPGGPSVALQSHWSPWDEQDGLNDGDWNLMIDVLARDGRLLWDNDTVRIWGRGADPVSHVFEPTDLFAAQAVAALHFASGAPPAVGFAQALRATSVADRILAAEQRIDRAVGRPKGTMAL